MDDYEQDVARQPRGPFSKVAERQTIRYVAEQYVKGKRYSSERNRRLALYSLYAKWIGGAGGTALAIYKLIEAFAGKGS